MKNIVRQLQHIRSAARRNKQASSNTKLFVGILAGLVLSVFVFLLISCQDAGAASTTQGDPADLTPIVTSPLYNTGYILDSAIEGLNYVCNNGSETIAGATNGKGRFKYPLTGSTVCALSVGKVDLGSFSPSTISGTAYTPYDIWPDNAVKASAFFQTLDHIGNLDDGIQLTAELAPLQGTIDLNDATLDLTSNAVFAGMLTALGKNATNIVSDANALSHLKTSIIKQAMEQAHLSPFIDSAMSLPKEVSVGTKKVSVSWTSDSTACIQNDGALGTTKNCIAGLTGSFSYDGSTDTKLWRVFYGDKTTIGPFILYGEYISPHVYFANVMATEPMDEDVSFVVSKDNTAPALNTIESIAKHSRRFKYGDPDLGVRSVYIAWDYRLTAAGYNSFLGGLDRTPYNANSHPWALTAGSDYTLYIYKGDMVYSHAFSTLGYKSTLAAYVAALPGSLNQVLYNTGLDSISAKGYVERKEYEPAVYNALFGPGYLTVSNRVLYINATVAGSCNASGTTSNCISYMPILVFGSTAQYNAAHTTFEGARQLDWLYFVKRTYTNGVLQALTSPAVLKAGFKTNNAPIVDVSSSMTYKTVVE